MPFTASHPAAVLPLLRWGLVPSALVIGSVVPDLPQFLPLFVPTRVTHTVLGLCTVDIALGVGVFVVWHALLAPYLTGLAPESVRRRVPSPTGLRPHLERWPVVLVSLVLGAATHLAWDAFTHAGFWQALHLDWLDRGDPEPHIYRWTQALNGVLGALVLLGWLVHWWRRPVPPGPAPTGLGSRLVRATWCALGVAAAAGATLGAVVSWHGEGLNASRRIPYHMTTWGLGAALLVLLACAAVSPRSVPRR